MTFRPFLYLIQISLLCIATSANAHHSSSTYNLEETVLIEGTVTRVQWVNPHVFIYVDQVAENGQVLNWAVEGVNPAGLRKVGWSRDTLKIGDVIRVTGSPSKSMASPGIFPETIFHRGRKLWDEKEFFSGIFQLEEATSGATSLAGVWQNPLTPPVIIPREVDTDFQPGTGLHDVTEYALERMKQFDELTMNPALNCIEVTAPLIMHFGDNKEIQIQDDQIKIISEYDGGVRVIHMNRDSHEDAGYSNQGHSIGRWEGSTLVVETTHFAENNFGNGFGLPSGPDKHLIERFTLSDDGRTISYQFTLTDPLYLASPMSLETQWVYQPNYEVVIDECNLESAQRFLQN